MASCHMDLLWVSGSSLGSDLISGRGSIFRATNKCQKEKRKTINGDDLLWAMATLGFEDYIEPLKLYLSRYRVGISSFCVPIFWGFDLRVKLITDEFKYLFLYALQRIAILDNGGIYKTKRVTAQEQNTIPSLRKALKDVAMEKGAAVVAREDFSAQVRSLKKASKGRRRTTVNGVLGKEVIVLHTIEYRHTID
ncbi:hypothetical protein L2E82_35043 [Cichorium intybus]|uniref:Uncharacterized protein n=1 Tax=Cichorium intybus TaxID=13427 RepID=A0ACB9BN63_CICIN|nr:hypothetical protein L2E82_35043 [Cichorium intybus]